MDHATHLSWPRKGIPYPRAGVAFLLISLIFATPSANSPNFEKLAQTAQTRYGAKGSQMLQQWRDMMQAASALSEQDKIKRVNEFFNRKIFFGEDVEIWNQKDYWATPMETMGRAQGDCEDFSIAKYFTLRILDVPNQRLRITYVKAKIGGQHSDITQAHMVLGYYPKPDDEPMILDNLITDVRPASRRPDLFPIFSFNSEGLWVGNGPQAQPSDSATARLSRWRDLIARMQAEGFE